MNKIIKFGSAIAGAAMLLAAFAPATFAATNVNISGNGKNSDQDVFVNTNKTVVVSQGNVQMVGNNVVNNTNTGGNKANDNLGKKGGVMQTSGSVNNAVNILVTGNANAAVLTNPCGCQGGDTNVNISGNLKGSDSFVLVNNNSLTSVGQSNVSYVSNNVVNNTNTGNNHANDNHGGVTQTSGDSNSSVNITVTGSTNSLSM